MVRVDGEKAKLFIVTTFVRLAGRGRVVCVVTGVSEGRSTVGCTAGVPEGRGWVGCTAGVLPVEQTGNKGKDNENCSYRNDSVSGYHNQLLTGE